MQGSQELITMAGRHCSTAEEMRKKKLRKNLPVNKISARNLELGTDWADCQSSRK